jgi:hypothetical protein
MLQVVPSSCSTAPRAGAPLRRWLPPLLVSAMLGCSGVSSTVRARESSDAVADDGSKEAADAPPQPAQSSELAQPPPQPAFDSEWLQGSGLDGELSVESYDGARHVLALRSSDRILQVLDFARRKQFDLARKLYLKLVQLLPTSTPNARISVNARQGCPGADIWQDDGGIQVRETPCRSSDVLELSPDVVAAVTGSPAGTMTMRVSSQLLDRIVRSAETRLRDRGQFNLISKKTGCAVFEVRGMRGQVLQGERWWETVQVLLAVQPTANPQSPVNVAWQASGRYGAGFRPPPADGYNADMEPAQSRALVRFVSTLLTQVQQDLEASAP